MSGGLIRVGAGDGDAALAALRRDGVVVIDALWPAERLTPLLAALALRFPDYVVEAAGAPRASVKVGNRRFFAPLPFEPPFDCSDVLLHPAIEAVLCGALGEDFLFDDYGVISSLPGARAQHIHRDGGLLFPETGLDAVLPPSALTIVVPLVAMDALSGTTAFWPGSHRAGRCEPQGDPVTADIPVGSCAIWDFRVMHSGLANSGTRARPLLYTTACRPFWSDAGNFVWGVNDKLVTSRAALEKLAEPARARFARATLIE